MSETRQKITYQLSKLKTDKILPSEMLITMASKQLLLIDDNEDNQVLVKFALENTHRLEYFNSIKWHRRYYQSQIGTSPM